jgi:ATP-dependent Lon protease
LEWYTFCRNVRLIIADQHRFLRENLPAKVVHFAPETVVHFVTETVVHYAPVYSGTKDLRDKKAIMKMASGFLKLLFPNLQSLNDLDYANYCLKPAIELRQRVRDQLNYLDPEYKNYIIELVTPGKSNINTDNILIDDPDSLEEETPSRVITAATKLIEIKEGEQGYSFEILFSPFLKNSKKIQIVDPFIRLSYQIDNLMELCKLLYALKISNLHLITSSVPEDVEQRMKNEQKFEEIKIVLLKKGISFHYEFSESIHDRYIETDDGWKITLGRGLDIFQKPESWFDLDKDDFKKKKCRSTIISYNRIH